MKIMLLTTLFQTAQTEHWITVTKTISNITISSLNITSPDYTNTWGTPRVDGNDNYYPARGASKIGFNWAGTLPTNIGSSDTVKIKFGAIKYSDVQ